MALDIGNGFPQIPRGQISSAGSSQKDTAGLNGSQNFEDVFRQKVAGTQGELRLSKHANERMRQRNIDLSPEQWLRLEDGVQRAGQKGIRESLVMVDQLAFIVNVNSNTVITAVGENDDRIFTNIDGAVIV